LTSLDNGGKIGAMANERMLSTGQAAKRLGVSVRTVYRWEETGRLHPVRLPSGQRRFYSREVERILRARTGAAVRCAVYARVSTLATQFDGGSRKCGPAGSAMWFWDGQDGEDLHHPAIGIKDNTMQHLSQELSPALEVEGVQAPADVLCPFPERRFHVL